MSYCFLRDKAFDSELLFEIRKALHPPMVHTFINEEKGEIKATERPITDPLQIAYSYSKYGVIGPVHKVLKESTILNRRDIKLSAFRGALMSGNLEMVKLMDDDELWEHFAFFKFEIEQFLSGPTEDSKLGYIHLRLNQVEPLMSHYGVLCIHSILENRKCNFVK